MFILRVSEATLLLIAFIHKKTNTPLLHCFPFISSVVHLNAFLRLTLTEKFSQPLCLSPSPLASQQALRALHT